MAGRIPEGFIDDLVSRVDIVDLIDARVPLKKAGSNHSACCPFHSEKTPSFTVSQSKQFFHCFGCGAHGSAISFLMDYDHLSFVEAVEELAAQVGIEVPRESGTAGEKPRKKLDHLYLLQDKVASQFETQLKKDLNVGRAVEYLKRRGVTGEVARYYRLGFSPPGGANLANSFDESQLLELGLIVQKEGQGSYDRFRNRIMFPIRNRRGQMIGFGGRVMDDSLPKYLNSPETALFHKGKELYGLYEVLNRPGRLERLLIVEGYMDVIAMTQFGIPYAVATLGTATSIEQVALLFRYTSELVFCFDGDAAGKKAAWRAVESALPALRDGREVRFMLLPEGEDPDSLVRKEGSDIFEQKVFEAKPLSELFFEVLSESVNLSSIEGRAKLLTRATPLIEKVPVGVFKKMMTERLKELAQSKEVSFGQEGVVAVVPRQANRGDRLSHRPSVIRTAIILLLHAPFLIKEIDLKGRWRDLDAPGMPVLKKVIDFLADNPELSLGRILEQFRGQDEENTVKKLAMVDLPSIGEGAAEELKATIVNLVRQADKQRIEALLARGECLSNEEKAELKQLYRQQSER